MAIKTSGNPLLAPFDRPFGLPPFETIDPSHFPVAFEEALAEHRAEIAQITQSDATPDFANTIAALERAGRLLQRVGGVFWNLAAAHTNPELQEIERNIAPRLAAHFAEIHGNAGLFARIAALYEKRNTLELDGEATRLLEKTHERFIRAGAALSAADKERFSEIIQRLATLGTQFSQNVLADEASFSLPLTDTDLAGLPSDLRDAAAAAAEERNADAPYIITLSRSLIEPFLTYSARRDLRETAYRAWTARGAQEGAHDNRPIIREILALRAERARMLGFKTFADFKLEPTMARTHDRAEALLRDVWAPALARAEKEAAQLASTARADGANITLEAWDWWYYAEKVRQADYAVTDEDLKPYFPLDQMIAAAFHTAERLFGLTFRERPDLFLYHADARAWEVIGPDGTSAGLFIGDYFARQSKRSGAWMSSFRVQERLDEDVQPIIVNVCNFAKGRADEPALLSLSDARTLFHEFGHALHGLMSDVTYPSLSGTSVEGDFVELPSQLFEHWGLEDEILKTFARHSGSGAAMPDELIAKMRAAETFNQGFATVEYLASALVDLALHRVSRPEDIDPGVFEAQTLQDLGMPRAIGMRHRSPHFLHVFAGDGYAAGYYSYMWSEVLDTDAFAAFKDAGDIFDPGIASKLKSYIYAAGGQRTGEEAYMAFRGRLPKVDGLLRHRGLIDV